MSDFDLILAINTEIKNDPKSPVFDQKFDPLDEIAVEIVLLEADHLVDSYMEQYRIRYRDKFTDPAKYDALEEEYRLKLRSGIRESVAFAREAIKDYYVPDPSEDEPDDDGGV